MDFGGAKLIRSNLGSSATPHEIYYSNVGTTAAGERVDLRIVNETEYRGYNLALNGITVSDSGALGRVNLLGPRRPAWPSFVSWDESFTYTQLRYTFISGKTGAPIMLDRTIVTLYDLDSKRNGQAVECVQALGARTSLSANTELIFLPH